MQRYGREEWRGENEYGRPEDERWREPGREGGERRPEREWRDERRGDDRPGEGRFAGRDPNWGRQDEWRVRDLGDPGWNRGERARGRGEGMHGHREDREYIGGMTGHGYGGGMRREPDYGYGRGYGREEREPERYGMRREGPAPWMEAGPDRSSGRESRGMYEWEDRGPLQWLRDKVRGGTSKKTTGPKGYKRSDDRIHDEVCERLARSGVDLSDVEVKVANGAVTLSGKVHDRMDKWRLEELADDVFGVDEVNNHLRVSRLETERGLGENRPNDPLRH